MTSRPPSLTSALAERVSLPSLALLVQDDLVSGSHARQRLCFGAAAAPS